MKRYPFTLNFNSEKERNEAHILAMESKEKSLTALIFMLLDSHRKARELFKRGVEVNVREFRENPTELSPEAKELIDEFERQENEEYTCMLCKEIFKDYDLFNNHKATHIKSKFIKGRPQGHSDTCPCLTCKPKK